MFNLTSVEALDVDRGAVHDGKVELQITHSIEYLNEPCVDLYQLVKKEEAIFISKQFCSAYHGEPDKGMSFSKNQQTQWFSLMPLFLTDRGDVVSIPESWQKAQGPVLKSIHDKMWGCVNPILDMERRYWGAGGPVERPGVSDPEAWGAFAKFLNSIENALQEIAEGHEKSSSLQTAGVLLQQLLAKKTKPATKEFNTIFKSAYSEQDIKAIRQEVQSVLFSEYPFLPEKTLNTSAFVVASWLTKRLLFHVAAMSARQNVDSGNLPAIEPLSLSYPEINAEYQRLFSMALLSEITESKDIERLKRGYFYKTWVQKWQSVEEPLAAFGDVVGHELSMEESFNAAVGLTTLRNLWKQKGTLTREQRELLAKRVHALFGISIEVEITERHLEDAHKNLAWKNINFYLAPTRDNFLEMREVPSNLAEEAAKGLAQEKIVSLADTRKKPYSLAAPAIFEILDEYEKLNQEGVEGAKLRNSFAREIITTLLQRGEGDFLELSREARHALIIGQNRFTDLRLPAAVEPTKPVITVGLPTVTVERKKEKIEEKKEDPFYKKWWFWTATGALLAAGGAAYGIWGRGKDEPKPVTPVKPDKPSADDNTSDDSSSDDDSSGDDAGSNGRGTGKTVGPLWSR